MFRKSKNHITRKLVWFQFDIFSEEIPHTSSDFQMQRFHEQCPIQQVERCLFIKEKGSSITHVWGAKECEPLGLAANVKVKLESSVFIQ